MPHVMQTRSRDIFKLIPIVVVAVGIWFTSYSVWAWQHDTPRQVTNFDECAAANDGAVMLSYPAQCWYDGKMFVNQKQLDDFNTRGGQP